MCQCFFSLVDLFPDEVLSLDTNCATSSTGKLGMAITWLFPFTELSNCDNMDIYITFTKGEVEYFFVLLTYIQILI